MAQDAALVLPADPASPKCSAIGTDFMQATTPMC